MNNVYALARPFCPRPHHLPSYHNRIVALCIIGNSGNEGVAIADAETGARRFSFFLGWRGMCYSTGSTRQWVRFTFEIGLATRFCKKCVPNNRTPVGLQTLLVRCCFGARQEKGSINA